jgi:aminopeptidase N
VALVATLLGTTLAAVPAVTAPAAPATSARVQPQPGAAGIGDPYFPEDGNGGYRVRHYDVHLRYLPQSGRLEGRATLTVRATRSLSRLDLDLQLPARAVRVDGRPAAFRAAAGHELVVTPAQPLRAGRVVRIEVRYAGLPAEVVVDGGRPWQEQEDGGAFVNGEPHNGTAWLPLNDHPADKASYDISVTVPRGWEAVAPGDLVGQRRGAATSTWRWRVADAMPSYQVFLGVGHYDFVRGVDLGTRTSLLAYSSSFAPKLVQRIRGQFRAQRGYLRWLEQHLGRYPFDHLGMVAQDGDVATLESLSSPVYGRYIFQYAFPDQARSTILHELAHQWFASSVTIQRWRDLWLNEGFATFVQSWYADDHGDGTIEQRFLDAYAEHPADTRFWTVAPGDPGPGRRNLFRTVYSRGSMTLAALRTRIGAPAFEGVLRRWAAEHRHAYGTTAGFVALAEEVSGQDLGSFFREWLYDPDRPDPTPANGFPAQGPGS